MSPANQLIHRLLEERFKKQCEFYKINDWCFVFAKDLGSMSEDYLMVNGVEYPSSDFDYGRLTFHNVIKVWVWYSDKGHCHLWIGDDKVPVSARILWEWNNKSTVEYILEPTDKKDVDWYFRGIKEKLAKFLKSKLFIPLEK